MTFLAPILSPSTSTINSPALVSDTATSPVISSTYSTQYSVPHPLPSPDRLAPDHPSSVVVPPLPPTALTECAVTPPTFVEPAKMIGRVGALHGRDILPAKKREMEGAAEVSGEEDQEVPPPCTERRGWQLRRELGGTSLESRVVDAPFFAVFRRFLLL